MWTKIESWIKGDQSPKHYAAFCTLGFILTAATLYAPLAGGFGILSLAYLMFRWALTKKK